MWWHPLANKSGDSWALNVKARVDQSLDFNASEARYHKLCKLQFSRHENKDSNQSVERPTDSEKKLTFDSACSWLENETEIQSISKFAAKMKDLAETKEPYWNEYVKELLKKKYGSYVIFQSLGPGKDTLFSFENKTKYLIEEKYKKDLNANVGLEEERMLNVIWGIIKKLK